MGRKDDRQGAVVLLEALPVEWQEPFAFEAGSDLLVMDERGIGVGLPVLRDGRPGFLDGEADPGTKAAGLDLHDFHAPIIAPARP